MYGWTSVIALRWTSVIAHGRTSVMAQFYLESKENTSWRCEVGQTQKILRKKAASPILAHLLIYIFLLPISLPYVNCASQKGCLFYLRSSLRSSDLPLFYFCGLFPYLLATAILDSFSFSNYLTVWSLVPLPFLNSAWTTGTSWFTYCWSLTWRILSIIC